MLSAASMFAACQLLRPIEANNFRPLAKHGCLVEIGQDSPIERQSSIYRMFAVLQCKQN